MKWGLALALASEGKGSQRWVLAVGLENKFVPPELRRWAPKVGAKTKSKASSLPRLACRLPGLPLLLLQRPHRRRRIVREA